MTHPSDETFLDEMARLAPINKHLTLDEDGLVTLLATERDRLVALARRAPALTWQPMETAPKDGTPFLILASDNERFVACWRRGAWELFGANARIYPTFGWMPLPAPPEARP